MSMKRKSTGIASADNPDAKRRKTILDQETPETTTTQGLEFLGKLKQSVDKQGRLISELFLTLPDRHELPEYYEVIQLPLAIDTIESKLQRREYPTLSALESDLKRMVTNAKQYNERTSEIHDYAEKIRKMVGNHFKNMNPAYKTGNYNAQPTPLPDESQARPARQSSGRTSVQKAKLDEEEDEEEEKEEEREEREERKRPRLTLNGPRSGRESSRQASSTPAVQGAADAGESFAGNSFQQAQEKLITELIDLESDDGTSISGPFLNLPSRELKDYYQVIRSPMSLKGVQKKIRGVQGREKPTGVSLYRTWQSFAEDISRIWNNARLYNEDGSEISLLADELEINFKKRLEEAVAAVPEPSQPKIQLRMPAREPELGPKLKINPPSRPSNGTGSNSIGIDYDALQRQRAAVSIGANGYVNGASSQANVASPGLTAGHQLNGAGTSRPISANGITDPRHSNSPAPMPGMVRNGSSEVMANGMSMPPPSAARIASGSPYPQGHHPPAPVPLANPLDNRLRTPGKCAADALITDLIISTHPALKISDHMKLSIPPSSTLSQQTVSITVPKTHFALNVAPIFSPAIYQRQHKEFVTCNLHRQRPLVGGDESARAVYDCRLQPGLNTIEVEVITAPPRGTPKIGTGTDVEFEKTTIFVNCVS